MLYEERLKTAIKFFESELEDMEKYYGGGGYDPHEATRVAAKADGLRLALKMWREQ